MRSPNDVKVRIIKRFVSKFAIPLLAVFNLLFVFRRFLFTQDANTDLLNYHSYVPYSLLHNKWNLDFHPAGIQTYLTPYQDIFLYPILHTFPGYLGTLLLYLIHLSLCVPLALLTKTLLPELSKVNRKWFALFSACGAMFMSQLGLSMGDILPSIVAAWGLVILFKALEDKIQPNHWLLITSGILFGLAVGLKFTMGYVFVGIFAITILLVFQTKAWTYLFLPLSMILTLVITYLPWGLHLYRLYGSPFFPFWNAWFGSSHFPEINYDETKLGMSELPHLLTLPFWQLWGISRFSPYPFDNWFSQVQTSEARFLDLRWVFIFALASYWLLKNGQRFLGSFKLSLSSNVQISFVFWFSSHLAWAILFGIQRYEILLESMALLLIFILLSKLGVGFNKSGLFTSTGLSILLVISLSTIPMDFGRTRIGASPIVPQTSLGFLKEFDTVVLQSGAMSYLASVDPQLENVTWVGPPFDTIANRSRLRNILLSSRNIGYVYYRNQSGNVRASIRNIGIKSIENCKSFSPPLDQVIPPVNRVSRFPGGMVYCNAVVIDKVIVNSSAK